MCLGRAGDKTGDFEVGVALKGRVRRATHRLQCEGSPGDQSPGGFSPGEPGGRGSEGSVKGPREGYTSARGLVRDLEEISTFE